MKIWTTKIKQGLNKKFILPMIVKYRKRKYQLPPMTIIASDCTGGVLAHDYGLPQDSPTVNLVIDGMGFVKFCSMIKYYMSLQLCNAGMNNGHPVAYCGDVRIDGVHYSSFEELRVAWERRKTRLHYDNMLFVMSERQIHNEETLRCFEEIEGNKIVFCSKNFAWVSSCAVALHEFERMFLFRGISGRRYIDKEFHFAKWYKQNSEVEKWNH